MEFLRRRKRLLLGVAAGAAGAAAAYYWWTGYTNTKLQQQRSVEMELTAILRGAALNRGDGVAVEEVPDGSDVAGDADDCGSPDLDESLDSHFNYIQKVSAPQELSNLLPRIQATLFELTDVSLVKQQQSAGGSGGVQDQLRLLARLCFGRTVAAAFLLPLMDLCVRTKLNVIGRHLFLQEKFSKLRQPAAPAARMRLPPRLTAAAAETFLACEQLVERGCAWLVEQAMSAADRVLEGTPLDTNVTPEELADLVQAVATALGHAATAAAATSPTGSAWVDVVVGPNAAAAIGVDAAAASGSAEAYRRALANAAMVEELESELRRVLCNYRFSEALHASVAECLGTCAAHIHATFISQAAAAQQQRQGAQAQAEASPDSQQEQHRVVSPFSTTSRTCLPASSSERPEAPPSPQPAAAGQDQEAAPLNAAPPSPSGDEATVAAGSGNPAAPLPRPTGSGGGARACLAAAAVAAMQPRPLARCLRAVQGACEPLFVDAREVSARIACMSPVMSLCAVAFAAPLEL